MSICIIGNPYAGNRSARRRAERFHVKWQHCSKWCVAGESSHVYDLARRAVDQGCSVIAAAGGDGTVHHVANAVLDSGQLDQVTLAVIPLGSANDYAFSVARQFGVSELDDASGVKVDVGIATTDSTSSQQYFLESLGVGLSAQVATEVRAITNLRGKPRYALAAWRVIRRGLSSQPLMLAWDDALSVKEPTLMLSLMLGQREGNMILAHHARLDDGVFDYVHVSELTSWQAIRMLPRLLCFGAPADHPKLRFGHCRQLSVESTDPLSVHMDGEIFCDATKPQHKLLVGLLPSKLRVKICRC